MAVCGRTAGGTSEQSRREQQSASPGDDGTQGVGTHLSTSSLTANHPGDRGDVLRGRERMSIRILNAARDTLDISS